MAELVKDGKDFIESVGMEFAPDGRLMQGGASDKERHRRTMEKWQELKRIGYEVATVVNCLPWPIDWWSGGRYYEMRAPKKDELFFSKTIKHPIIDQCDMGDAKYAPSFIMPAQIALDACDKYKEEGGVFLYRGSDSNPPAELNQMIVEAREKMLAHLRTLHRLAHDNWQRYNKQTRMISGPMRLASRILHELGEVPTLPEWVTLITEGQTQTTCPACAETLKKGAKICRFCGFKIDKSFNYEQAGVPQGRETASTEPEPARTKAATATADEPIVSDEDILADRVKVEPKQGHSKRK